MPTLRQVLQAKLDQEAAIELRMKMANDDAADVEAVRSALCEVMEDRLALSIPQANIDVYPARSCERMELLITDPMGSGSFIMCFHLNAEPDHITRVVAAAVTAAYTR